MEKLRVVVSGLLAQYPLGGVTWDYFQYVLGLHRMGMDVFYMEDTGLWPFNPEERGVAKGCEFNVRYLSELMGAFGLEDRWAYRFPWEDQWFGLGRAKRNEVVETADVFLNVSGTLRDPSGFRGRGVLAYIDSDPVFTQVKLARGQADFRGMVDAHDVHFSFGEAHSEAVPDTGHRWRPTRQPVVLDAWTHEHEGRDVFTTVMNWTSYKPIEYQGRQYGQKDMEFRRFMDLPAQVSPTRIELAVNDGKTARTPRELLQHKGWLVVDPNEVCADWMSYRSYLQHSRGEWSVAKHGYVEGRAGWFSCRSACYLAAGRPVVVQDTGFTQVLPTGSGLLAFQDPDEAAEALRAVEANYPRHSRAASEIADTYFEASGVLSRLLTESLESRGADS